MNLSKSAQLGRYARTALRRIDRPESELQAFTDDYLTARGIEYIRVPDTQNGEAIRRALCGMPDNTALIPVGGYSLAMSLELKTRSKMHGRQLDNARRVPWVIAQDEREVERAVSDFVRAAEKVKKLLRDTV